jgi:hypothetical protein
MMGNKKLPNTAGRPGMTTAKIIIIPWRVKKALYVCADIMVFPGAISSNFINNPKVAPMAKNESIEYRYNNAILL